MNVRFFHVSSSLDKKNVRKFLNYDEVLIMPEAPREGRERCGLLPILDVLNLRQSLIPMHLSQSLSRVGLWDEWCFLVPENTKNWGTLRMSCCERENRLSSKEQQIRENFMIPVIPKLHDVFKAVAKTSSPNMWRFLVPNMTIIPTSVACEQSFSYFKRTQHVNMGEKTAKIFLMARLSHYNYDYNL